MFLAIIGKCSLLIPAKINLFEKFITESIKEPPDCSILDSWVFENFTLSDKSYAKALQIFEICVLVSTSLCEKLVSSLKSTNTFDASFKVT